MDFPRRFIRRREQDGTAAINRLIAAIDGKVRGQESTQEVVCALDAARVPLCKLFCRHLGSSLAAKALAIKVLNLLLAKHHFLARSTVLLSRPYGLMIDPSNGCNLACPGCVHSSNAKALRLFDWNKGLLSEERLRALLRRYGPYAVQVMFCNYGEPTTNLHTPKLIEIAKSYLAQTALSSNLTIARFDADAYVQSRLDFMFLSIDGATQKVYERYRKNGDIEIVYRNIERLVRAKRISGKRTPVLRWQYLAFEHNAHEIPLALETARALGVDQFAVETPFDVSWDDPNVRPAGVLPWRVELDPGTEQKFSENWDLQWTETVAEAIERAFEDTWAARPAQQPESATQPVVRSSHTCHWLYKNMVMDANGRIIPCCAAPRPDLELVFSHFSGEPSEDCFNSDRYRAARLFFADREAYPARRALDAGRDPYCTDCRWNQLSAEIDGNHVAQYLRAVGNRFLDAATIEMLRGW